MQTWGSILDVFRCTFEFDTGEFGSGTRFTKDPHSTCV